MSRTIMPYAAQDISALARFLKRTLDERPEAPSHLEWLNILARGVGFQNFQHFRAQTEAWQKLETPAPPTPTPEIDLTRVRRLMRFFDAEGRLLRYASKVSEQEACMWVIWAAMPTQTTLSEQQMKEWLATRHTFGDHALLRRALYEFGMVTRTADGGEYRRVEQRPPPEALALIGHLSKGAAARG